MSQIGMQRHLLNIAFIFIVTGCSLHQKKNISELVDFYGADTYAPKIHKFDGVFKNLKGRKILYMDSYIGKFILYYSPDVLDSDTAVVPHVSCYSASLDFPDDEKRINKYRNHMKCAYYEVVKYYSGKPGYFFEIKGKMDLELAKKISEYWYEKNDNRKYIAYISKSESNIDITISGGACTGTVGVEIDSATNEIEFREKRGTFICS